MDTVSITNAERKKYVREILKYHKTLSERTVKAFDYYLQKFDDHLDWLDERFDDLDKGVQDVLEAESAEAARKIVQLFERGISSRHDPPATHTQGENNDRFGTRSTIAVASN